MTNKFRVGDSHVLSKDFHPQEVILLQVYDKLFERIEYGSGKQKDVLLVDLTPIEP